MQTVISSTRGREVTGNPHRDLEAEIRSFLLRGMRIALSAWTPTKVCRGVDSIPVAVYIQDRTEENLYKA